MKHLIFLFSLLFLFSCKKEPPLEVDFDIENANVMAGDVIRATATSPGVNKYKWEFWGEVTEGKYFHYTTKDFLNDTIGTLVMTATKGKQSVFKVAMIHIREATGTLSLFKYTNTGYDTIKVTIDGWGDVLVCSSLGIYPDCEDTRTYKVVLPIGGHMIHFNGHTMEAAINKNLCRLINVW